MRKVYECTLTLTVKVPVRVEAESEDEAYDKCYNLHLSDMLDDVYIDFDSQATLDDVNDIDECYFDED